MAREEYQPIIRGFETVAVILFVVVFIFFRSSKFFLTFVIISLILFIFPNWLVYYIESLRRSRLEAHFPDFIRDLSSAIKSGKPLPLALKDLLENDYGHLTPYVHKIAHQVDWGVPVAKAFKYFAITTEDPIIERSMSTVIEAIKSGGEMEQVLDAVYKSLLQIKTIEEERKSMIFRQVVQNYIIYFVFLGIMIVMQNMLLPTIQNMASEGIGSLIFNVRTSGQFQLEQTVEIDMTSFSGFFSSLGRWFLSINGVFMSIVALQGFFTGLMIGKFSTGSAAAGTKHSFILVSIGLVVMSIAQSMM